MTANFLTSVFVEVPEHYSPEQKSRFLNIQLNNIVTTGPVAGHAARYPRIAAWSSPAIQHISKNLYLVSYEANEKDRKATEMDFGTNSEEGSKVQAGKVSK